MPRAVDAFSTHFKPRGIYFGTAERQVVKISSCFRNDHRRFKARKFFTEKTTSATPSALVAPVPSTWLLLPYTTTFIPFTGSAVLIELANTNSLSVPSRAINPMSDFEMKAAVAHPIIGGRPYLDMINAFEIAGGSSTLKVNNRLLPYLGNERVSISCS